MKFCQEIVSYLDPNGIPTKGPCDRVMRTTPDKTQKSIRQVVPSKDKFVERFNYAYPRVPAEDGRCSVCNDRHLNELNKYRIEDERNK